MNQSNRAVAGPDPRRHHLRISLGVNLGRGASTMAVRIGRLIAMLSWIAPFPLVPTSAYGQACPSTVTQATWVGSAGSVNWSLPLNWQLTCYPDNAATSVSLINAAATTVVLDTSVVIDDLTIGSADVLDIPGTSGNIGLMVAGTSISNGGVIELSGNGSNGTAGTLYIGNDVTLSGGGTITLSSPSVYGIAYITQSGTVLHTLTNVDNTIQGNGVMGLNGLRVVNQASGIIDATSASGQIGTLTLTGGATVTNSGLLEATTGTLLIYNPVANSGGNITANGGTVELGDAGAGATAAYVTGGRLNTINGGLLETAPGQVATLDGVTLSNGSAYSAPDNSFTHILGAMTNAGTVAVTGGNGHNSTIQLDGDATLNGGGLVTLTTNAAGGGVALIAQNGAAGSPVVTLTNLDNSIVGNGLIGSGGMRLINGTNGLIEASTGAGQIGTLTVSGGGAITNQGVLEAENGATLSIGNPVTNGAGARISAGTGSALNLIGNQPVVNQGLIRESGGSLLIQDPVANTGGVISAVGGLAQVNSAITGGVLDVQSGGLMETLAGNTATLNGITLTSGSTYTASNNAATHLQGTIGNAGTITVNGGNGTFGDLYIDNDVTLGGGGAVTLSSSTTPTSYGAAAIVQSGGVFHTLTNVDNTIQGNGLIGNGGLMVSNEAGGIIDATTAGGEMGTLTLTGGGTVTNGGLIEATSGTLILYNPTANTGGNITANGGIVELGDAGAGASAAYVTGGTLNTINGGLLETAPGQVATLDGVAISRGSAYTAPENSLTHLLGTIANGGTVAVSGGGGHNATVQLESDVALTGGGTVAMTTLLSGGGAALIQENGASGTPVMTLTNVSDTLEGNGIIGNGGVAISNESAGAIRATTATGQSSTLYVQGGGILTNAGTLGATAGATVLVSDPLNSSTYSGGTLRTGTYVANGTIQVNALGSTGGEIVTNAAHIILDGSVAGTAAIVDAAGRNALSALADNQGSFLVRNGGNADFTTSGNLLNSGNVDVGAGTSLTMGTGASRGFSQSAGVATVDGTLSGSNVTINGGVLNGTGTVSGAVTVGAGGTIQGGDAPGTLTVNGSLTLLGTLSEQIDAAGSFGVIDLSGTPGTLTLGSSSTLGILLASGYVPAAGTSFTIANFNDLTGTFGNIEDALFNGGTEQWNVSYNPGDIVLTAGDVVVAPATVNATWSSGTAASWTTASDWSCAPGSASCVPNNGTPSNTVYGVNLDNTGAGATLTVSGTESVDTLTLTAGKLDIATGASLNLANQPAGLADIAQGASLSLEGRFTVGSSSALAGLSSIEGTVTLDNGQSTAVTPAGGSLMIAGTGGLSVTGAPTSLKVNGNVGNSGGVNIGGGASLASTGTYTQSAGSTDIAGAVHAGTYVSAGGTTTIRSGGSLSAATAYQQTGHSADTDVSGTLSAPAVILDGGTLSGDGTVQGEVTAGSGATVIPGQASAPAVLTIYGDAAFSGADLTEVLAGDSAGTGYAVLDVGGEFSLSNTALSLIGMNDFTPVNGQTFDIANAQSLSGEFSNGMLAYAGGQFLVSYDTSGCADGYAECVNLMWQSQGVRSVPEPGGIGLFAAGLAALACEARRRRRRRAFAR